MEHIEKRVREFAAQYVANKKLPAPSPSLRQLTNMEVLAKEIFWLLIWSEIFWVPEEREELSCHVRANTLRK